MARFNPDLTELETVQDKVIVLTGGASGIGAATVRCFYSRGALIVFGDLNTAAGHSLAAECESTRVLFLPTNVTVYEDNLALFRLALKTFGRVDHAFSIAGVIERGRMIEPGMTIESVEQPHTNATLDVNLIGVTYFIRIAMAYLAHDAKPTDNKSITLMASSAGLIAGTGLFLYTASKHAVLGLMRSLRNYALPLFGIRVNAVCPAATDTSMMDPYRDEWLKQGYAVNTTADVAEIILGLVAGKHQSGEEEPRACNGLAILVTGGKGWEVEEGLVATMDMWMGPEAFEEMKPLRRFLLQT